MHFRKYLRMYFAFYAHINGISQNHYGSICAILNPYSTLQKSCISFAIEAKPLELYVPAEQSGFRYHIWRLVTSGPFENLVMLLIIGNTILLMLKVALLLLINMLRGAKII